MLLSIERGLVEGSAVLSGHSHAAWHLCFVSSGGFDEESVDGVRTVVRGQLRISAPHTEHTIQIHSSGADCTVLNERGIWRGAATTRN